MTRDLYERLKATYNHSHAAVTRERDEYNEYEPLREAFGRILSACPRPDGPFRVMDAGCGTGRYFHLVPDADLLVGHDYSHSMLLQAKAPYRPGALSVSPELIVGDILNPPFREGEFDLVFSIGVFGQELAFEKNALTSLLRLVRGGGRLVMSILSSEKEDQRIDYYTPVSAREVAALLTECGVREYELVRLSFSLSSISADEIFHCLIVHKEAEAGGL